MMLDGDSAAPKGSDQNSDSNEKQVDAPLAASQPDPLTLTTGTPPPPPNVPADIILSAASSESATDTPSTTPYNVPDNVQLSAKQTPHSTSAKSIPEWYAEAQKRFEQVFRAPEHISIVQMWLEYEELLGYPEDSRKNRLTNQLRPQQVSDWMQRHRLWDKAPPMDKASEFGAQWKGWWKALQPEWRVIDSWPLARDGPVDDGWKDLMKGGGNGFVLVLLSLSWWMMREKDETRRTAESDIALEDVQWALQRMLEVLRARREQGDEGDSQRVDNDSDLESRPKKRCVLVLIHVAYQQIN